MNDFLTISPLSPNSSTEAHSIKRWALILLQSPALPWFTVTENSLTG